LSSHQRTIRTETSAWTASTQALSTAACFSNATRQLIDHVELLAGVELNNSTGLAMPLRSR
jgi:hypothetical protein